MTKKKHKHSIIKITIGIVVLGAAIIFGIYLYNPQSIDTLQGELFGGNTCSEENNDIKEQISELLIIAKKKWQNINDLYEVSLTLQSHNTSLEDLINVGRISSKKNCRETELFIPNIFGLEKDNGICLNSLEDSYEFSLNISEPSNKEIFHETIKYCIKSKGFFIESYDLNEEDLKAVKEYVKKAEILSSQIEGSCFDSNDENNSKVIAIFKEHIALIEHFKNNL